ncbi:hypothetical protein HHI36_023376 [Cryptolaemus montrouzieri]|uniref:Uncharacterized protein n=1 Tax=Cryptolaemus montrouzieri TaxID=559131 RepID=A0ABD2PGP2_9CUCU
MQLNVQCLTNEINNLDVLLAQVKPDIFSIAEPWCTFDNLRVMSLRNYVQAASFCRPSRGHGYVVLYVRSNLQVDDVGISDLSKEMEFEFVAVKFILSGVEIIVVSAYRPPSGDFQVFSLVPTRVYTNVGGSTSSSKNDYILTNADIDSYETKVFEAHIGDHKALSLVYCFKNSINKNSPVVKLMKTRNITPRSLDRLVDAVSNVSFEHIYASSDVDFSFQSFIDIVKASITYCCLAKFTRYTTNLAKNWISGEVKQASVELKKLY